MKIVYVANVRIPTEKAHGLQIMKMCQAFIRAGHQVELVIAKRANQQYNGVDPFDYYRVKERFLIKRLPLINMVETGRSLKGLSVIIQNSSFALTSFFYLLFNKTEVIYARDEFSLFLLSFFRRNLVLELHRFPSSKVFLFRGLFRRVKKIVVITNQIKQLLVAQGIAEQKIIVAPDGVDLEQFDISDDQTAVRQRCRLPLDRKIVVYTGHLWQWKGVYVLAEAARYLPADCQVVFIGGMEYDSRKLQEHVAKLGLANISFVEHQPPSAVPYWLKAADCLALPNSGKKKISQLYTSPLKLFEYMAAQRPIVASQLPSITEILNEKNAVLVLPDDPQALADGIMKVLKDQPFSAKIVKQARLDVEQYSWQKRAEKITSQALTAVSKL